MSLVIRVMSQDQQMQTDYKFAIQTFMDDPNVDIVMPWFVFQDDPLEEKIVDILAEFNKQGKKPILLAHWAVHLRKKWLTRLEENECSCLSIGKYME